MRVVHVNTEPTWRGGENQVLNLLLGLRRRDVEVEVVARSGGELARRCRAKAIPVLELPLRGDLDLRSALRLARHLRGRPCDIVHAQTARAHSIGLIARALGAPGLLVVSRRLDFPVGGHPLSRWKYRTGAVAAYIAVAQVVRDALVAGGVPPERVTVIHSSIDLAAFEGVGDHREAVRDELGIPRDAPLIGNVAALAWHKGQEDLVASMPAVLRSLPEARLLIVGEGELRHALERRVRALGLERRVLLAGARRDVPRVLTALDLFCIPSYYEGLCNAVLEAFAMKVPVVAARAGGLPEIVIDGRTGLLAAPHDPESLAAAILRSLGDRRLAAALAAAGHALVHERFGSDLMVERTCALYAKLLAAGGGR